MFTLVAGPPCAGKTTYIREHARPGDLILEWDALAGALTGTEPGRQPDGVHEFVAAAFYAVLGKHRRQEAKDFRGDVWVSRCAPHQRQRDEFVRMNNARVVILPTPAAECRERAAAKYGEGERLDAYNDTIDEWWTIYLSEQVEAEPVTL